MTATDPPATPVPNPDRAPPRHRCVLLPWRSATCAWVVTGLALLIGVPIFLRLPPWVDLTLYDTAAMNLLRGGVHYRDVFDTNLPGFTWALTGIRAAFGWSVEVIRTVDLLIVAGVALLLYRLALRAGATRASAAWAMTGIALFYPFTTEFNQVQRDTWMLLPTAGAVLLRIRRLTSANAQHNPRSVCYSTAIEGLLWGLGVWIKPHVVVPAAAVWLATAPRSLACGGWRGLLADLAGNVAGGAIVGAIGLGYIAWSGTWPAFVETFTFWNAGYAELMWLELPGRFGQQPHYFPPWSYLPVLALPLALLYVVDAWPWVIRPDRTARPGPLGRVLPLWAWDPGATDGVRVARLGVAVLYLAWTAQALFFQRMFHYVHVPEIFLLLALLATQRWMGGFLVFAWMGLASVAVVLGLAAPEDPDALPVLHQPFRLVIRHELARPGLGRVWVECWRTGLSDTAYRQRMMDIRRMGGFHAMNDWDELGEVEDWLRAHHVTDGEVLCWHDAPHALYVALRIRPPIRFQHVSQMMSIGPAQEARVLRELNAAVATGKIRYVVSDLMRPRDETPERVGDLTLPGPGPHDLLPPGVVPNLRAEFPFYEPAVFRTKGGRGRYVIHELKYPVAWPPHLTERGEHP